MIYKSEEYIKKQIKKINVKENLKDIKGLFKLIIGIPLLISSPIIGLYVGIWIMFIGGIIQIINQFKSPITQGFPILMGIIRIMFATPAGVISGLFVFLISVLIFSF